jgi:sugar (pentulose or hexulose) kinase
VSSTGGSVLVVDVGTSGVRAAVVRPDATVEHAHHAPVLPDTPQAGLVEFDAARMAEAALAASAPGPSAASSVSAPSTPGSPGRSRAGATPVRTRCT